MFTYKGALQSSKSVMNRSLIIQSYNSAVKVFGFSNCEDVLHMQSALQSLKLKEDINCGEAGTVLRFMMLRASREPGTHRLYGSERLLRRPHNELLQILKTFGVQAKLNTNYIEIVSEGWKQPEADVVVSTDISSQYLSSLILNAWNLDWPLVIHIKGARVSEGYWSMTRDMLTDSGMQIIQEQNQLTIPAKQIPSVDLITADIDFSSLFALAVAAIIGGDIEIDNFASKSLQPDSIFTTFFDRMGIQYSLNGERFAIAKQHKFSGLSADLKSCPDLAPVLSVLLAFADSKSELTGIEHLQYKESNRLKKCMELLKHIHVDCHVENNKLFIYGNPDLLKDVSGVSPFTFDPDQDHRMAMAAAILKLAAVPVEILTPEVISKSYPDFWNHINLHP